MEPTLNINDRVLVIKDKFLNLNYKIGDVIVFYNPDYVYQKAHLKNFMIHYKYGILIINN